MCCTPGNHNLKIYLFTLHIFEKSKLTSKFFKNLLSAMSMYKNVIMLAHGNKYSQRMSGHDDKVHLFFDDDAQTAYTKVIQMWAHTQLRCFIESSSYIIVKSYLIFQTFRKNLSIRVFLKSRGQEWNLQAAHHERKLPFKFLNLPAKAKM